MQSKAYKILSPQSPLLTAFGCIHSLRQFDFAAPWSRATLARLTERGFGMRAIWGVVLSCTLATVVAGCNGLEYFREGIGSELYSSDAIGATENQEVYLGLICRQAGLPSIINADGTAYCDQGADWGLVVQAGMNDIDRRCDAYLAWLDDKRRSNEPILKELAAISASTLGILNATNAGVRAITITGIAFGLAANTFVNINSRLLSLEQSTIQSLVLDSQQRYRENIKGTKANNRPDAIYYLRGYLRICLPFSIETSVNNTVTVVHRAGPDALGRNEPLFTRVVITDPKQRFAIPGPGTQSKLPTRLTDNERLSTFTAAHIRRIQQSLCVKIDGDLGPAGSVTRRAIGDFLEAAGEKRSELVTDFVDNRLNEAIEAVPDCKKAGLVNASQVGARLK